ncbi:MAG: PHP domain-containing protein, partial [Butyricicoccus sp.]
MKIAVAPKVFRVHSRGIVRITLTEAGTAFAEGAYFASVVPTHDFWIIRKNEDKYCALIPCVVAGNELSFAYDFGEEQEYGVKIFRGGRGQKILETSVYALEDDLFGCKPLLGDFHVHTTYSDGKQSPGEVCAAYCRAGFEALAITDHFTMDGSRAAKELFQDVPLPIALYYGEEVHTCQKNHLVNFGDNVSVNEWFQADPDRIYQEIRERMDGMDIPEGVDRFEAAALATLAEKLRENGGISVFAHPFWRSNAYHLDPRTARWALEQHLFDAFELLGGHGVHENNLQVALWTDLLRQGVHMPVLGCSDSHTVANRELFNNMKT